ncbi:CCD96 protein, partial [Rhinopomastus cyanomelas]|nr:CCD96 protein [Rhinopomastus cyanomelas]
EEEDEEEEALLAELHELESQREALRLRRTRLQLRLGELLRREPCALLRREAEAGPDLYAQRLRELLELRKQREEVAAACKERVSARQRVAEEREAQVQALWTQFQARKKAVILYERRLSSSTVATKTMDLMQALEWDKEQRVREARVENIRLNHEIQNLEIILKAQGEGQRFMDFEYLKKENQNKSKKIDDLSAEILKLKKKVSNIVLILSQFKEKLQFVEAENEARKAELMGTVNILSQKRDILTKTKQARDRLRTNNLKLQQKCGLLGNEILLQDFEETVDTIENLSGRLETLKRHHADLIRASMKIQEKIREANS